MADCFNSTKIILASFRTSRDFTLLLIQMELIQTSKQKVKFMINKIENVLSK